jgi:hypothetical protein
MIARQLLPLALVLAVAATAAARLAPTPNEQLFTSAGRSLQQQCSRIPNCVACRNERRNGATVIACTACAANYQTTEDKLACTCQEGFYRNSTTCTACGTGRWCDGEEAAPEPCGVGLTTLITTAGRYDQCVTVPGYGMVNSTSNQAELCPKDSFSSGKTRNPCRACGRGLKTQVTSGASNITFCMAPPGSFFDKSVGKLCPRGTYMDRYNYELMCTPCPKGLTTPKTGSTSIYQCSMAKPGFMLTQQAVDGSQAATAVACAKGFWTDKPSYNDTCNPCPSNMTTMKIASSGSAACVAPPGYGYKKELGYAVACASNTYKPGFNRRDCVSCGLGFLTVGEAKVSFSDCYVPVGYGTIRIGDAYQVAECVNGTYGIPADTFGVRNLPCVPCPLGMSTNSTAGENRGPEACWVLPGWGYNTLSQTATICEKGVYNEGYNREPCTPCGVGYTTDVAQGARSADSCVIAPGYGYNVTADPEVCPIGQYGPGGTKTAECEACPSYSSTVIKMLASSTADCKVCVAGYGSWTADGPACTICPAGSYQPGGSTSCTQCPEGYTSAPGSDSLEDCYKVWQVLPAVFDYLPLRDDTQYTASTADTADACKADCDSAGTECVFYNFNANTSTCSFVKASSIAGSAKVAFKAAEGVYTVYGWNGSKDIGDAVDDPRVTSLSSVATSVDACAQACDKAEECVAFIWDGSSCKPRSPVMDVDYTGSRTYCQYKAYGERFNKWQ